MSERHDLLLMERRLLRALGIRPAVLTLAVACGGTGAVDAPVHSQDAAALERLAGQRALPVGGTTGLPSAPRVVEGQGFLQGLDVREGAPDRADAGRNHDLHLRDTFQVALPQAWPADHVTELRLRRAPRDVPFDVQVTTRADESAEPIEATVVSGYTNLDGEGSLRIYLPANAGPLGTVVVTVYREHGDDLVFTHDIDVTATPTQALTAPMLHPQLDADTLAMGQAYRACAPDEGAECPLPQDFHAWEAQQLAAYALDQPLDPTVLAMACGLDTWVEAEEGFDSSCCYVVSIGLQAEAPFPTCARPDNDNGNNGGGGGYWYEGRPFEVEAGRHSASVDPHRPWPSPDRGLTPPADAALRAQVAHAWQQTALAEHASIASFSRFQLELLSLGAPADLLARSAAAIADELRHAEHAFAVASALGGEAVGPSALPIEGALARSHDIVAVLTGAIVEGCINETIAAVAVQRAADQVDNATLADDLRGVADDEARHAELSWAFVRWLLAERPELVPVAQEAFASFDLGEAPEGQDDPRLAAYGVMGPVAQHALGLEVLQGVVRPCAEALFAAC